ncbi:hypothetical protein FBY03_11196 [Pseudomonas sp. SJZ079]|uniref:hypothetical protein n=1 Tax=Pseudomonas sp. SJZ079 TaxID=2572887 RepID=UPI001199F050|nr:hypothetical protein [Pseudomonas sp. SJZ079]TWC35048.1 hypothetical protein FBY03_11196 [Pseudomonas sp. SJZ079]
MTQPLWGFPWHGLLISPGYQTKLRVGDAGGAELPINQPPFPPNLDGAIGEYYFGGGDLHVLRLPGIAPLSLTPEETTEQAALGRTWQNYTLLHTSIARDHWSAANGLRMSGWVCIDAAGDRWLVKPVAVPNVRGDSLIDIGEALTLKFDVVPFGYLGQAPVAPVQIEATLADLQQDGEPLGTTEPKVLLRTASIASHGREVLIALYAKGAETTRDFACGWLKLECTGVGPDFGLSLSVVHSRADCLGNAQTSDADGRIGYLLAAGMSYAVADRTLTGSMIGVDLVVPPPGTPNLWPVGTRTAISNRSERILNLVYDDADQIVTLSADLLWTLDETYDAPSFVSASGTLVAGFPEGQNASEAHGRIDFSVERTATASETHEVLVKRNGSTVDQGRLRRDYAGSKTEVLFFEAAGGYAATLSPAHIDAKTMAPVWTDGRTRTDSFTINGAQAYSYTSPANQSFIAQWTPYAWGSAANFTVYTGGQYSQASYGLRRVRNQLIKAQHSLYNPQTGSQFSKEHRFIASQALWDNPVAESDPFSLTGSYNPVTHELYVDSVTAIHI